MTPGTFAGDTGPTAAVSAGSLAGSRFASLRRAIRAAVLSVCAGVAGAQSPAAPFDWDALPNNTWVRLSTTGAVPVKNFHAGMTIDSDGDVLLLFGSESHELASNYDNSVRRLDLSSLVWSQDYPPDPITTYTRTATGILRTTSGRPWGDHAFDAVDYVPPLRKMAVAQWPEHAFLLKKVLRGARAATWLYDPDAKRWQVLATSSPKVGTTVYDPDTRQLVGYDGRNTYVLSTRSLEWRSYTLAGGPSGYHLSMAYDSVLKKVLAYGDQDAGNQLYALDVARLQWRKIDTALHPPGAAGAAIVYSRRAKALLLLAPAPGVPAYSNTVGTSETWAFHSLTGDWRKLSLASPPVFGMNYHRVYDEKRNVFLYAERAEAGAAEGAPLTMWALRYVPDGLANGVAKP